VGFVGFTPDPLGFEQVEEALGDRVIITVSSSAHAGFQIAALQKRLLLMAGRGTSECLNTHWFMSLADTAEKVEAWRRDYNEQRPHSAIGNQVPAALIKPAHASGPCV
jgi:putative transposase